jgi:hypothetical protein
MASGLGYQTGNDLRDSIDAYFFMRSNSYPDFCIESLQRGGWVGYSLIIIFIYIHPLCGQWFR